MRTALAALAFVVGDFAFKTRLAFPCSCVYGFQLFAVLTGVFILFRIILHILSERHIVLEFARF